MPLWNPWCLSIIQSCPPQVFAFVQILDFSPSIAIWRSVGFVGHWIILAILLVGLVFPPRKPAGSRSQKPSGKGTVVDAASPADGKANPASGTPSAPSVIDVNKSA